ncbi:flavodoxin/nitric oxide synthase [Hyphomicrobium denitrificans 1NES1]|uniref:Sulfite reductase [NADPH] flavoprotein alpha-component n=1 Tax=Hyphomicrobium denitrificans 1NES1 TaxID=670307 RepID=N0B319_9HYPH|nr:flavodoxin domain-containing protein [Hyphomicrobium denitrificans]AGK57914.1 flavodoxin/nitric oxide synthase [Hyphomicrobium denitrificans 1NES1]
MTAIPLLPRNAPFLPEDIDMLNKVVAKTTPQQRAWLAGFFAGFEAAQGGGPAQAAIPAAKPRAPLTILYASESGNTEALAGKAKKAAQKHGLDAKVFDMADADLSLLPKSKNIVVYAATWGEGDPPSRAVDFYQALMSDAAPRIDGVRFAVLALGDTAYAQFCAIGKAIDARLEELGGVRVADRVDLDLDYAKQAADWTEKSLVKFAPADAPAGGTVVHVDFGSAALPGTDDDEPRYTAESPLEAEIATLINLNGTGSTRETWHAEFAFDDPTFAYQPGDAIGLVPENDPVLVDELLKAVGLASDAALLLKLQKSYDVTTLSRSAVENYAKLTGRGDVKALLEGEAYSKFAADRQLVDLFETYPEKLTAEQLTGLLRPLPGRLYSVASSLKAHPGEAHLLVGAVRWESHGKVRKGVSSTYLGERRKVGSKAKIYVKPNRHYRLPADGHTPIIMIGAGTGVAPYRAFVEERVATGAKGKSWLFFGERNFTNDFLYQLEWQDYLASGDLSRIDVAFSRDQPEKIYVQHRLWERRVDIAGWLDDGAHLYVCGDEKGMAKDVDQTLVKILAEAAKGDEEAGRAKLKELAKAGRYQRDVY